MSKGIILAFSAIVLALSATSGAYAWQTKQSANAVCEGPNPVIRWEFKNKEPNKDKWSMDVVVKDSNTGKSQGPVTAAAGETISGSIDASGNTLASGHVTFDLTWTDGRHGKDSFKAKYSAVECQPETVEVCRDGKVVTINKDERLETDTEAPCPTEEKIEVCRDGKIIEINPDERLETDTDACVLAEEELPEQLPVTGPGAMIASFFGASGLFAGIRSWLNSRRLLKQNVLSN
jgi:hypothetical protein